MTRVLVVDDSALMRRHIREMLERDGEFEVHTARNGADALEQIRRLQPDVVTLDVNMPVMDGLTCLRHRHGRDAQAGGHGVLAHGGGRHGDARGVCARSC